MNIQKSVFSPEDGDVHSRPFSHTSEPSEPLSSPLTGTFTFQYEKIIEKVDNCGSVFDEYYAPSGLRRILPIHCDNRICENDECKQHRLYKYMHTHYGQIAILNEDMRSPKAWVFTGWVVSIASFDRHFAQSKLLQLFKLLSNSKFGSLSHFSVHMELKVYPEHHKNYGFVYLHFHVVSGGLKDLRMCRRLWGRQIKYEQAINPNELGFYVSKYASKTPKFPDEEHRFHYARIVYKLQMHRFSVGQSDLTKSGWVSLSQIEREVYSTLYRDSYLNPKNSSTYKNKSSKRYYFKFLEPRDDPPPLSQDDIDFINSQDAPIIPDDDPDYPFEPIVCMPSPDVIVDALTIKPPRPSPSNYDDDLEYSTSLYLDFVEGLADAERSKAKANYRAEKKRIDGFMGRIRSNCGLYVEPVKLPYKIINEGDSR